MEAVVDQDPRGRSHGPGSGRRFLALERGTSRATLARRSSTFDPGTVKRLASFAGGAFLSPVVGVGERSQVSSAASLATGRASSAASAGGWGIEMRVVRLSVVAVMLVVILFVSSTVVLADGRVALEVGNSTYDHIGRLPNPENDAVDMAAPLQRLGFDVTTEFDADRVVLTEELRAFTRRSAGADVSLVFYAGHGIEMDGTNYLVPVVAVRWYRRAADQEHALAQNNLGVRYRDGLGVEQDYGEAVRWFRRSAEQGHAGGQANLGWTYENGRGLQRDRVEAVRWYRRAADQGDSWALEQLDRLR